MRLAPADRGDIADRGSGNSNISWQGHCWDMAQTRRRGNAKQKGRNDPVHRGFRPAIMGCVSTSRTIDLSPSRLPITRLIGHRIANRLQMSG